MTYGEPKGLAPGSDLPDFWLPDTEGVIVSKDHLVGAPAILVVFMNNSSPYVKHMLQVMVKLVWEFRQRGVAAVAINPSDTEQQADDCPGKMKEDACTHSYTFPYLFDGTQEVARRFRVDRVPDFFVFDRNGHLVYHGRMDDSTPENGRAVTGRDLRSALNSVLLQKPLNGFQIPGRGSEILWRSEAGTRYAAARDTAPVKEVPDLQSAGDDLRLL